MKVLCVLDAIQLDPAAVQRALEACNGNVYILHARMENRNFTSLRDLPGQPLSPPSRFRGKR